MTAVPLPVILAGGLGTRLGTICSDRPKPMVEVAGRPFLEHLLCQLATQGFRQALLLLGYRGDTIRAHFGNGEELGVELVYSQEPEPLGTGGALRLARHLIPERFLLLYGDLYRNLDYMALAQRHPGACLGVYPYVAGLHTIACGNVDADLNAGRVTRYLKNRPEMLLPYVDAGFGLFHRHHLDALPEGKSSFEETLYGRLAEGGELALELVDRNFYDIGNPEDLAHTRKAFAAKGDPCASS